MSRTPSRILLTFAAGAALAVSLAASPGQPVPDPAQPQPQPTKDAKPTQEQPARTGATERPGFRERMRERCTRLLNEAREDQTKLEEALKKFDAGSNFEEIREVLPERLAARFRSGDSSPDSDAGSRRPDRFGGRSDQPFSADDWEAVNAIIKHAQPDMLQKFDELRQADPGQAQKRMLEAYPRLRPLLDLYKHDRTTFDLRLEELAIIRQSMPLAKDVIELRRQGKTDDSPEIKAAREKLRDLGQRHHTNRLAIQRREIEAMRQRLLRREKDIADQAANPDRSIDRAIDGLIKQAERGSGNPSAANPERRGGPPDGPRRRPGGND